jgi:hypothetical protein
MSDPSEHIPDKITYQVNRRRMCWVALGCMVAMVSAIIYSPEKYGDLPVFDMAFLSLAGLVAAYFGASAIQKK